MKNILFFHQSADMYGSDKVLLQIIEGLDRTRYNPMVVLPTSGPLSKALEGEGVRTFIIPLALLSRATLTPLGMLGLPLRVVASLISLRRALGGVEVELAYSNTLAVLTGALWARLNGIPHIWHVHEIIKTPRIAHKVYPILLKVLASKVICNSTATLSNLTKVLPSLAERSYVVWNGMERKSEPDKEASAAVRRLAGAGSDDFLVVLVGRINDWKGQRLLVEAATILEQRGIEKVRYLIVGDTASGGEPYLELLGSAIENSSARERITVTGFREDIWPVWDAADVAVVPSTLPEPFGLVVIEAMCAAKPVIAAAHGGPCDIVIDGETGLLVAPDDAPALADAIEELATDRSKAKRLGSAGRSRAEESFSLSAFSRAVTGRIDSMIGERP